MLYVKVWSYVKGVIGQLQERSARVCKGPCDREVLSFTDCLHVNQHTESSTVDLDVIDDDERNSTMPKPVMLALAQAPAGGYSTGTPVPVPCTWKQSIDTIDKGVHESLRRLTAHLVIHDTFAGTRQAHTYRCSAAESALGLVKQTPPCLRRHGPFA